MILYRPLEAAPGHAALQAVPPGRAGRRCPTACRCSSAWGCKVLDERPYRIAPEGRAPIWMHDFGMQSATADADVEIDALHAVFEDAFGRVFRGEVENDDFNRLVRRRAPAGDGDRRSCAPTRSTCGRSAFRCRRRSSRRRWRRTPASRAMLVDAVQAALRSGRRHRRGRESRASRCARSSRRSKASRTCPRTACCASTSR